MCFPVFVWTAKGLKQNVHRNGISGGKIEQVLNHMKVYDLKQFSSVIIYVGGNDAANGSDPELFEEMYDQGHVKLDFVLNYSGN